MKNSNESLANEKFYTTRISSCVERQHDLEGYIIKIKGYPDIFQRKRCFNPEKDKNVFVRGEGWKTVKQNNIHPITVPKIETYSQVLELVEKYGYRCASEMVGFNLASYGDHYPISDIAKMQTFGASYVEYLERIASLDYKILQYFITELKCVVRNNSYDMWIEQGVEKEHQCSFRTNPFLGFHLETCFFGMIPTRPQINPISLDENLWKVIKQFHPEYKTDDFDEDVEIYIKLKAKFDSISVKGWIEIMCGKEDAEWLSENLTFKGVVLKKKELAES